MSPINLDDFWELCEAHDWHYERSDDPSVYRKGRANLIRLSLISEQTEDHFKLYADYIAYKFNNNPKPERPINAHIKEQLRHVMGLEQEV